MSLLFSPITVQSQGRQWLWNVLLLSLPVNRLQSSSRASLVIKPENSCERYLKRGAKSISTNPRLGHWPTEWMTMLRPENFPAYLTKVSRMNLLLLSGISFGGRERNGRSRLLTERACESSVVCSATLDKMESSRPVRMLWTWMNSQIYFISPPNVGLPPVYSSAKNERKWTKNLIESCA